MILGFLGFIIGFAIIALIILTFYLYSNRKNNKLRAKIYDMNKYFDSDPESYIEKVLEKYLSVALTTPNFDFSEPIYYNDDTGKFVFGNTKRNEIYNKPLINQIASNNTLQNTLVDTTTSTMTTLNEVENSNESSINNDIKKGKGEELK